MRAIAWKLFDIKGINPKFCTHKILMEEDFELVVEHQRRVNPKSHDVINQQVLKLLDVGLIYPISDSPWSSEGVYTARKPLKFLRLATMDPPGDITAQTTLPRRCLTLDSIGPLFTVMPKSSLVMFVNVKKRFQNGMKCHKISSMYVRFSTFGALTSWGPSRLHEEINIYSWLSTTCRNGLKRKSSPPMTPELFANSLNLSLPDLEPPVPSLVIAKCISAMTSSQMSCLSLVSLTIWLPRIICRLVGRWREEIDHNHDDNDLATEHAQIMIIDSLDMNYDREEIDHNHDDNDLATEQPARRNSKEYASQMELECAKVRGCYNDNLALILAPDTDEVIRLEKESHSKLSDLIRPFDYDKLNNLYDLFVPQREKSSKQRYFSERSILSHTNVNNRKSKESFHKQTTLLEKRMDESIQLDKQCQSSIEIFKVKTIVGKCKGLETELSKSKMMSKSFESVQKHAINLELELQQCKEKIKNDMLFKVNHTKDFCKEHEQYFEIQDLKAQLQDKGIVISELNKLIKKLKGKSVDTKFEKSSVIQQPNAFKSQRPSVLGKPTTFSNSFVRKDFSKSTSVTQTNVSNDFSKLVTAQTLPTNKKSILKNTNVLVSGMYKLHTDQNQTSTSQLPQDSRKTNKRVSFSTGVIPITSVSRPQLKSNPMGDRVMHNNS
nr:reverse transcriptase domain-containing protein, chloroplastic [Tanacetum cinerariifolium]